MVDGFQSFVDSLDSAIPKVSVVNPVTVDVGFHWQQEINPAEFRESLDSTLQQLHQLTVYDGVSELKVQKRLLAKPCQSLKHFVVHIILNSSVYSFITFCF